MVKSYSRRHNITISEIADLAGVSKTTVSRVLNDKPDVNPETRERILEIIAEHDYQPNVFAKAISLQKSNNIGLLIPHTPDYIFTNQYYVEVLRGVSTAVDNVGYSLLICYAHERNFIDIYKQQKVDGFILLSPGAFHYDIIEALNSVNAPFVSTSQISSSDDLPYVDIDNCYGGKLAVEHLIDLGHERISFVGKPTMFSSQERLEGYKATLAAKGLPYDERLVHIAETSSIESGYKATAEVLKGSLSPTAFFLANDVMAIGSIKAIFDAGLRVPQDISVVGFDDILLASYTAPPLTTIWQPAFQKGVEASNMLMGYLEVGEAPPSMTLDIELMVRELTAPPPSR